MARHCASPAAGVAEWRTRRVWRMGQEVAEQPVEGGARRLRGMALRSMRQTRRSRRKAGGRRAERCRHPF